MLAMSKTVPTLCMVGPIPRALMNQVSPVKANPKKLQRKPPAKPSIAQASRHPDDSLFSRYWSFVPCPLIAKIFEFLVNIQIAYASSRAYEKARKLYAPAPLTHIVALERIVLPVKPTGLADGLGLRGSVLREFHDSPRVSQLARRLVPPRCPSRRR